MSELKVDTVVNLAGTGKPNFQNGITVNGAATSTLNLNQYTASSSEPSSPDNGALWWDTANEKTFIYAEGEWKETIIILPVAPWYGDRAVMGGGYYQSGGSADNVNTIEYFDITSTGNASDFGDLSGTKSAMGAASNSTRGLFAGSSGGNGANEIQYITIATTGNTADFGDLTVERSFGVTGASDATYAVFDGGWNTNTMDYVTIATTGNATDFGDATPKAWYNSAVSDGTYGVWGGGESMSAPYYETSMFYVTLASTGNSTDFGDLTRGRVGSGAAGNATRGVFTGGTNGSGSSSSSYSTTMDYITISTPSNALDFGDLTVSRANIGGTSNLTRGVFTGGRTAGYTYFNNIDYITIDTLGDATDFGDMTEVKQFPVSTSGSPS